MATKDNGKGVAIAKRAKISKAEQNMFIAVCLASVVLGVTAVAAYHLIAGISFNAKVLKETAKIRDDIKTSQDNLNNLATEISNLSTNENLESVGRANPECANYRPVSAENNDGTLEDITTMRTCSALRVVADALPSQFNNEAAMNSINKLIFYNDDTINIENLAINDNLEYTVKVNADGLVGGGEDSGDGAEDPNATSDGELEEGAELNINVVGATVSIKDSATKVRNMMSSIEDSIRNYDIRSITISWSQEEIGETGKLESKITMDAVYSSYYSDSVMVGSGKKKICADETNAKCTKSNASEGQ